MTHPLSIPDRSVLDPLGLTSAEFARVAAGRVVLDRQGGARGATLAYRRVFREGLKTIDTSQACLVLRLPSIVQVHREPSPEGEVIKFLTRLDPPDSARTDEAARAAALASPVPTGTGLGRDVAHRFPHLDVESVLIPMIGSTGRSTYTLCVSSQVGCAMGCTFCETAQMGLVRSLRAREIVAQWFLATHELKVPVKNIVFMGMGEPLDNLEEVLHAIDILKDHNGPGVPVSQITVSTVGRVDGLVRLAQKVREPGWHRLGIALSLNAPNDALRNSLMPVNRRWNLAEVQRVLVDWPRFAGNKICVEYVQIPGVNDRDEHAREIADFLAPFRMDRGKPRAMLNLIPYNPRRDSPWPAPDEVEVDRFLNLLISLGVFVKRRRTKGRLMMGACGQLGAPHIRKRTLVLPTVSAP